MAINIISFSVFSFFLRKKHSSIMKLSKMYINKILDYISQGMSVENACYVAGISEKTYYLWFNKGEEDAKNETESLQRKLYDGIPAARARCEQTHLQNIMNAGKKNWRASAWFLERTRPHIYGRNSEKFLPKVANDKIIIIR